MQKTSLIEYLLLALFFLSGLAAITYQLCWQRILYFSFGSDIESITVIVSIFMLGLGIGALIGGLIADKYPNNIILGFSIIELCIGLISPLLMISIANYFSASSLIVIATINFFVLLIPTSFMGATLPMLITYFFRTYQNIGFSTGQLYFINTLGSASGALLVGFFVFSYFDLKQTIYIAAFINLFVSLVCLSLFIKDKK